MTIDEFQALEQKVLRAVDIVRQERQARAAAEAQVAGLREQLAAQTGLAEESASIVKMLETERGDIRKRVEKMLSQMDEML